YSARQFEVVAGVEVALCTRKQSERGGGGERARGGSTSPWRHGYDVRIWIVLWSCWRSEEVPIGQSLLGVGGATSRMAVGAETASPLLKFYRDLWLKDRHEIWKVTMGAASFGVGKSHNMVDRERLAPMVLQAADKGGWQESMGDGP
ncbi:hypothetical protein GW17_00045524, partial [Ensete ventricosum]